MLKSVILDDMMAKIITDYIKSTEPDGIVNNKVNIFVNQFNNLVAEYDTNEKEDAKVKEIAVEQIIETNSDTQPESKVVEYIDTRANCGGGIIIYDAKSAMQCEPKVEE